MREYEFSSLAQVQAWSEAPRGRPLFDSVLVFENWLGELPREQWLEGVAIREFRCNEGSDQPLTLISVPARRLDLVLR